MEMIHTTANDRIIQRFDWSWDNRKIWMDGGKLPNVDDYPPRSNGYSTARWECDTPVIPRECLDHAGVKKTRIESCCTRNRGGPSEPPCRGGFKLP